MEGEIILDYHATQISRKDAAKMENTTDDGDRKSDYLFFNETNGLVSCSRSV
jgi:hypothetical protein